MIHHHLVLLCLTILAFDAAYSQSKVSIKAITDDNSKTVHYNVNQEFVLKCNLSEPGQVEWQKDSKNVDTVTILQGRFKVGLVGNIATYTVKDPTEADAGTYACVFIDKDKNRAANDTIVVVKSDKPAMKVPKNINVVEGETLKIECLTRGELTLMWIFDNETHNETYFESSGRVKLETNPKNNQTNGILRIDDVQLYDRGDYTCVGKVGDEAVLNGTATVRVKDKYAALWPFLGICAEVFVLCAIIFIYEKKRNKTELEESDTDQSPDQKNTPDHGKDSNLRHRQ